MTDSRQIITVKVLAAKHSISPKRLRSILRDTDLSTKPTDGTAYQWYSDSKELARIETMLKDRKNRKGIIR